MSHLQTLFAENNNDNVAVQSIVFDRICDMLKTNFQRLTNPEFAALDGDLCEMTTAEQGRQFITELVAYNNHEKGTNYVLSITVLAEPTCDVTEAFGLRDNDVGPNLVARYAFKDTVVAFAVFMEIQTAFIALIFDTDMRP